MTTQADPATVALPQPLDHSDKYTSYVSSEEYFTPISLTSRFLSIAIQSLVIATFDQQMFH